ncbi:hypothetical protein NBRC116592_17140 [Colwellia sp. KU-HH00111]|uniref:AAA family ATPase n=1 Tax=Colwellia sp. KU-HH00111 TaxID=3127652 RepID=UPI003102C0D6
MQTINRNNQTITLSTTPTHFKELNAFSIVVLQKVFGDENNKALISSAFKFVESIENFNLIYGLGGKSTKMIEEIEHSSFIYSRYHQSILSQNKLLKKCRQAKNILISQGNEHARSKFLKNIEQINKINNYSDEYKNCALNNIDDDILISAFAHIYKTSVGESLLNYFIDYKHDLHAKLANARTTPLEDSLIALNDIVKLLEASLRDPSLISIEPVDRSYKSITLNKLFRLLQTDEEMFQLCCADLHARRLAKIVLPLANDLKEQFYSLLNKTKVNSIRVEVNALEAKLFKESKLKFQNKSEDELSKVSDEWEESLFRKSYGAVRELDRLIKIRTNKFKEFDTNLVQQLARPYVFTEITQFKSDSIRQMLKRVGLSVLEKAFFFAKDDPSIEYVYEVSPSLKETLNNRFAQIYDFDDTDAAFRAQKDILHFLNNIEAIGDVESKSIKPGVEVKKQPKERRIDVLSDSCRVETKAVFDRASLEIISLERDAMGENGSEIIKNILEQGENKKVLYATENMIVQAKEMFRLFPNFSQPLEEILVSLKISLLTNQPIEFPVISLQGLPGIGKTQFVKTLCKLLGFEFYDISIASMGSKHDLVGGSHQFKNSSIGEIGRSLLLKSETYQPCLLLDELCLAKDGTDYSIVPCLLSLLDSEQRKSFKERFLDIEIDCSGILLFSTTNNIENLLPAVRSRLTSFDISPPNSTEMRTICNEIYKSYVKEKNLTSLFSESLSSQLCLLLNEKVPREAKAMIISGIKRALIRASSRQSLITVTCEDLTQAVEVSRTEKPTIGFIH